MDKFAGSIKKKYQERRINYEKEWPLRNSRKLVRSNLVERERDYHLKDHGYRGTPLGYGDLFKMENVKRPLRKILVEGGAGTGKTTLCTLASEDWADGKLFQQFELLLLLPLRQKQVASAGSVSDLLKLLHSSEKIRDTVAHYLEDEEGEKVLIIADGWDELSESNRQEESFLYQLLFQMFPFMSVVLTSRPSASSALHRLPFIDRIVELQGFTKENIEEYVQSEFSGDHKKAEHLLLQVESNPLVGSVCSNPLNCAIICHLWHTFEEALPTTMTGLYTNVILNVAFRNIQKTSSCTLNSLPDFDSLPKNLQKPWWLLCEFAFRGIEKDQTVFSQDELAKFFPDGTDSSIFCFGLLQSSNFVFETGCMQSFHFLHLTFQEYLATLYLLKQPLDNLLQIIHSNNSDIILSPYSMDSFPTVAHVSTKSKRFAIVWQLFFGIYFNQSILTSQLDIKVVSQILSSLSDSPFSLQLICNCAFEAKNEAITGEVIQSLADLKYAFHTGQLFCYGNLPTFSFGHPRTAYDCSAVIYIMSKIHKCGFASVNFNESGITDSQMKSFTDVLASKHGKLQFVMLNLRGNKLTDESVSDLFHRASASFQLPATIDLSYNMIGAESISSIVTALRKGASSFISLMLDSVSDDSNMLALEKVIQSNPNFLTLNLSHNPLGVSGLQALENAICSDSLPNLENLYLEESLTNDADVNAACLNSFLGACVAKLSFLDISHNNLGVAGAQVLSKILDLAAKCLRGQCNLKAVTKQLELSYTMLSDKGMSALFQHMESPCDLIELGLGSNSIHATGLLHLADVICSGKIENLFKLHLDDNPLGHEAVITLGRIISNRHHQICTLALSRCQLTTFQADLMVMNASMPSLNSSEISNDISYKTIHRQLYQMPPNYTITSLQLNGNCFNGESILVLAGFVRLCSRLHYLASSDCEITTESLIKLLDQLAEYRHSSPSLCSELKEWDLSNNKINDTGLFALEHYIPSLFPNLDYMQRLYLDCNLVSLNSIKTLGVRLSQDSAAPPKVTKTKCKLI